MIFVTRLVTHDNDDQPIPAAVLNCILREAEARFGGYTLGNPESGSRAAFGTPKPVAGWKW